MSQERRPLNEGEKVYYNELNAESLQFLMNRYNRVNRWVIADMIRRSAYRYPDKKAVIFGDLSLTYSELEAECNRTAHALADLGVKKYDRVAILAHNTVHHVLT
ncbi:MAG: AMP-binding protein, partial [Thermodesulfobacteriota bacterium]